MTFSCILEAAYGWLVETGFAGAFFGAMFAYFLVVIADYRRKNRNIESIRKLIIANLQHVRAKKESVENNIKSLQEDGNLVRSPIMKFPIHILSRMESDSADLLSVDQIVSIDAILYFMEEIDNQIGTAEDFVEDVVEIGLPIEESEEVYLKLEEYSVTMNECIKNLGYLEEFCQYYGNGEFKKIVDFSHPMKI